MSSQFKDIKHRVIKQLTVIFPTLQTKHQIKKSPSLQPLYKVIPCPPIPPRVFKQTLDIIITTQQQQQQHHLKDNNTLHNNYQQLISQTLTKTCQYFTACINILQHNEKVRQQYQLVVLDAQDEYLRQFKQISQLKRLCANVKSKSQLSRVINLCGGKMLGLQNRDTNNNDNYISDLNRIQQSPLFLPNLSPLKQQQRQKLNNNNNNNKKSYKSNKQTIRQQFTQLYLPAHPDQYQFITEITQDQYLTYHQQVLQKLLIYLNTITKIIQQLQQQQQQYQQNNNTKQLLTIEIKQLLTQLMREQLFCVQDNCYNRLIKFVLKNVHDIVNDKIQLFRVKISNSKQLLKQSLVQIYYLQFMAREELQIITSHIQQIINTNQQILLMPQSSQHHQSSTTKTINNNQQIKKQLQQLHQLKQQTKLIFCYLCQSDNRQYLNPYHDSKHCIDQQQQQVIFPLIYKRKLKKFIIKYNKLQQNLLLATKINKTILQTKLLSSHHQQDNKFNHNNNNNNNNSSLKDNLRQSHSQQNNNKSIKSFNLSNKKQHLLNDMNSQLQTFANNNLQTLMNNVNTFINSKLISVIEEGENNNHNNQIILSSFIKLHRQIQQCQLKMSEIQHKLMKKSLLKNNSSEENSLSQLKKKVQSFKIKILDIENTLINNLKQTNKTNNILNLLNKNNTNYHTSNQYNNYNNFDTRSITSHTSSSKSSIFIPIDVQQSDIILPKVNAIINNSYLPNLQTQQLIKTAGQFVTNQFVKNIDILGEQLEDAKNVNFQMLNCLIFQVEREIDKIGQQVSENRVSTMSPRQSNNEKLKQSPSQSPQKNRPKGKMSRQKPMQKSPSKPQPKKQSSPSKKQPQSQQQIKKQQPNNKSQQQLQLLLTIKDKLIFIRQVLCPQISQCRISKIFQQTLHIEIFQKLCSLITNYKQNIFTQRIYSTANKFGFMKFVQQRVNFINTFIKNQKQLIQIFKFIKIFSQQRVKFQATDERTFEIILKALLAAKQIQVYRRQNLDLSKMKKLSSSAVKLIDQQIYIPFILMFKNLLKITSSEYSVIKELGQMLESVKLSIEIKQDTSKLLLMGQQLKQKQQGENENQQIDSLVINKIEKIMGLIIMLKRYPIFKYSKIEAISKALRSSLNLQPKAPNENKKQTILSYLRSQLLQAKNEGSQPILS